MWKKRQINTCDRKFWIHQNKGNGVLTQWERKREKQWKEQVKLKTIEYHLEWRSFFSVFYSIGFARERARWEFVTTMDTRKHSHLVCYYIFSFSFFFPFDFSSFYMTLFLPRSSCDKCCRCCGCCSCVYCKIIHKA